MFLGNILQGLARVLDLALTLYMYVIIARAVLSWVSPDPYNPIVRFIHQITEPVMGWIRRKLPFVYAGGIDFSPIVAILAIAFLRVAVVQTLFDLAVKMRQ